MGTADVESAPHPGDPCDPNAWLRGHFLAHPPLLPRLLGLCTGLAPPAAVSGEARGGEVLLRAQGGPAPWYLLSVLGRPDEALVSAWPLLWLDLAEEAREDGWHVVLTDQQAVMDWLEGPDFHPRYGVHHLPLALDLSHQIEALRRPEEPLLTTVALWTARGRQRERAEPLLRQLCAELWRKDDALLAVPLLRGVRAWLPPWGEEVLRATSAPSAAPAADPPSPSSAPSPPPWWPAAVA